MVRNLRTSAFAIGAVLALCFVSASTAPAASFTASSYSANVTGSNSNNSEHFSFEAGSVLCDSHFVGSLAGASSTLTLTPTYSDCEGVGYLEGTTSTTPACFVLHSTSTSNSTMDITCKITFSFAKCKWEIKSQNGLAAVNTTNLSSSVTVEFAVTGIAYTVTEDGFLCAFNGTGNKTGATYTNDVVLSRVGGGGFSVS